MALTNTQLATEFYIAYFNRAPDPVGLNIWVNALNNGVPLSTIAADFANSAEAQALYPFLALHVAPDPGTAAGFVNAVYENLLNRTPDTGGLTFWTNELTSGQVTVGQFILDVIESVNAQTGTPDALTLANKVAVGDFYANTVATLNAQFSVAAATAAIAGVNSTAASVTTAENNILGTTAHNLFTLTAGADTIVDNTGIGHDIVNAPLVTGPLGLTTQSLSVGDTIALTGPNNVANLDLGGTLGASWPAGTTISGVQTINFQNVGSFLPIPGILPAIIPGNDITGMTTANMLGAGASVLIGGNLLGLGNTGLPTLLTTVGMTNTGVQTFALEVQGAVLAAATAPALAVNLSGVGGNTGAVAGSPNTYFSKVFFPNSVTGAITTVQDGALWVGPDTLGGAGYATLNFNVTGEDAIQLGTFLSTSLTTVNIAGTGGLLLDGSTGTEGSKVTTITSTAAGPVIITGGSELTAIEASPFGIATALSGINGFLEENTALTSVTTGAGNDWVDISSMSLATVLANGLKVDLGTGTNELVVDATVATSAAPLTFFTDVQILGVAADDSGTFSDGLAGTINVANLPAQVVEIQLVGGHDSVDGNLAITNVGNNFTVDVLNAFGGGTDNLTIVSTTPGSTFTTTLDIGLPAPITGSTETDHSFIGQLTVSGFGTVDLNSFGDGAFHNTINQAIFDNTPGGGETVNLAGTDSLVINENNTPVNNVALAVLGNGSFLVDTDLGSLTINGTTNAGSVNGATSGGVEMFGADLFISGLNIGDAITGSAKAFNVLAGSNAADAITTGAAGDIVTTMGGGDAISTPTSHAAQTFVIADTFDPANFGTLTYGVDPSLGGDFAHTITADATAAGPSNTLSNGPGGTVVATPTTTVVGDLVGQQGFWNVLPGFSGAVDLTQSGTFGTSFDQSTISNFHAGAGGDTVVFAISAWESTDGTNFGLLTASGGTFTGGTIINPTPAVIEAIGSGGTIGGGTNGAATVTELTGVTFANAATLANALSTGADGYLLAHFPAPIGDTGDFIVAYSDGTNVHIADVNLVSNGAATGVLFSSVSAVHVSDLVQLTGVSLASLSANNIGFHS